MRSSTSASNADPSPEEVVDGFVTTYFRLGQVTKRVVETAAWTFALAEVLARKGLLDMEELDAARASLQATLHEDAKDTGLLVEMDREPDKYAVTELPEIDCEARIPLCKAACCRMRFGLSEQDIHEGVVQFDLGRPYLNRQREDGYCTHSDTVSFACSVYEQRPGVCRRFDCRKDERIWLDFEARIVNPDLLAADERMQ